MHVEVLCEAVAIQELELLCLLAVPPAPQELHVDMYAPKELQVFLL